MKQKQGLPDTTELTLKFEFNPKDGIDNPVLSLAEDSGPEGLSQLRFCFLKKEDEESFGFWLRQEVGNSGHLIRQVKPGSLAHRKGLREGDRILEVNGVYVDDMEHFRVVWKIQSSGKQVSLTVLDGNAYSLAKALDRNPAQFLPPYNRPRLCCVAKDQNGFGFSVSAPEGVKGTFRMSVLRNGPADKAGVPDGSWLLELNGMSVKNWTYAGLNKKLKQSSSPLGLLVIEAESEDFYQQRNIKITAALADTSWLPFEVRKLPMVRGPSGYGFLLKEERCSSGKKGQFLREVDAGLPAEKAGMRDGDRLLGVNGESTEDLDHHGTVSKIRADRKQVTLLVIDAEGSKFYDLVGLSPLVFYDDQDALTGSTATCTSSSSSTLQENSTSTFIPCHLDMDHHQNARPSRDGSWDFSKEVTMSSVEV
ncbi:Na(+)/H(+) exchange regulatory cofactor NHE-RF4 isoform X2 [Eublepharis macularius]|uniref:Na(+)/H(+) exchange regulatory cofactor NHE-RF4 isoform X2 n=1 Tax=Eublepharis macularius TaxID=481883 RepID=A0AA97LF79_EUBMA|nr:Na(+)/H(+) exchange regulatory cofactor NHE-RF4 isoform X2 [Eublepharis macularius]XP_054853565.1 Na(+)/H(+) exchange regulatory cofactor NHE-RF4 isoform X2 [Eublepharis macularius]